MAGCVILYCVVLVCDWCGFFSKYIGENKLSFYEDSFYLLCRNTIKSIIYFEHCVKHTKSMRCFESLL